MMVLCYSQCPVLSGIPRLPQFPEGGQGGHQAEGQGRQGQSAGGGGERGLGAASQGGEEQGASQEHIRWSLVFYLVVIAHLFLNCIYIYKPDSFESIYIPNLPNLCITKDQK